MSASKPKSFKQPSITNFFSRKTEPDLPPAKYAAPSTKVSKNIPTIPWEELERRHQASMANKDSPGNGKSSDEEDDPLTFQLQTNFATSSNANAGASGARLNPGIINPSAIPVTGNRDLGVSFEQLPRVQNSSQLYLPPLSSTSSHAAICLPQPALPTDIWDSIHARMPFSSHLRQPISADSPQAGFVTRWEVICNSITRSYQDATDFAVAKSLYTKCLADPWTVSVLNTLLGELPNSQVSHVFQSLLPFVAKLVMDTPSAFAQPIPLLKAGVVGGLTLSQKQIGHLLANSFFCTFPDSAEPKGYPSINFERMFMSPPKWKMKRMRAKVQKLKCILAYFDRISSENHDGNVTFERRSLSVFPDWERSDSRLSDLYISYKGTIEDAAGCLQADFANRFVGGGVLNDGCVQEEIRFVINPELIVSRLFTESLRDNEVLIITGAERFSDYEGYGDDFRFKVPHDDPTPKDSWNRRMTQIVAMDATKFDKVDDQYKPQHVVRELRKAYAAFYNYDQETPPRAVATGNWGCGAYRGEPRMKFIIQLLATSAAGRSMAYFTFGDERLQNELFEVYNCLRNAEARVGDVYRMLMLFADELSRNADPKQQKGHLPLTDFLLHCFKK